MSETLREDELALVASSVRCVECPHLEVFHWSTDEDSGCSVDCECSGFMSAETQAKYAAAAAAERDPNDPIPRIWAEPLLSAVGDAAHLQALIDRSFDDKPMAGQTITTSQYGAMNPDGTWDVQNKP